MARICSTRVSFASGAAIYDVKARSRVIFCGRLHDGKFVQDVDRLFPRNSNADVKSDVPEVRCSSLLAMFLMRILLRPVAHFVLLLLESRSVIIRIARVLFPKQKRERKDEKVPAKCRRDRIALF